MSIENVRLMRVSMVFQEYAAATEAIFLYSGESLSKEVMISVAMRTIQSIAEVL